MTYAPRLFHFLENLAQNNDRAWFAANRQEYDELRALWIADLQRLIDCMKEYEPAFRYLEAKECLYRIYRDTRFSPDKTPYKTYFSALISPTGRHCDRACYYFHQGADECALYGGIWMPEGNVLKKLRKAILDNLDEFNDIISKPELQKYFPGWEGRKLKTAPQGYDRNHPQIELLRLTEYGKAHYLKREFFDNPNWPEEAAKLFKLLKPLNDFINYSIDE